MIPPARASHRPVATRQWQGARQRQEDTIRIIETPGEEGTAVVVLLLADGMGGAAAGALASGTVVEAFALALAETGASLLTRMKQGLQGAIRSLREQVDLAPGRAGMGSTVLATAYDGRTVSWLSVGDSPMWLFANDKLTRLNEDHSMAPLLDQMAESGQISSHQAQQDKRRNMLRSAVTAEGVEQVDCRRRSCQLLSGDFLLLASDGLQTLTEDAIRGHLVAASGNAETAASSLLAAVQAAGRPRQDNVSLLLLAGGERPAAAPASGPGTEMRHSGPPAGSTGRRRRALLLVPLALLALAVVAWSLLRAPETPDPTAEPAATPGAASDGRPAADAPADTVPDPAGATSPSPEPAPAAETGPAPTPGGESAGTPQAGSAETTPDDPGESSDAAPAAPVGVPDAEPSATNPEAGNGDEAARAAAATGDTLSTSGAENPDDESRSSGASGQTEPDDHAS